MFELDVAIQRYAEIKTELEDHENNEPIGVQYDKEDRCRWIHEYNNIYFHYKNARDTLSQLLDEELDEYFRKDPGNLTNWDKTSACLLLKERLD